MTKHFPISLRIVTGRNSAPDARQKDEMTKVKGFGQRRLRMALGPFRRRVRHVEAILRDLNGPRGGVDQSCLVTIQLEPWDLVVVESRDDSPYRAIADAARRAAEVMRRRTQRGRSPARRPRRSPVKSAV